MSLIIFLLSVFFLLICRNSLTVLEVILVSYGQISLFPRFVSVKSEHRVSRR